MHPKFTIVLLFLLVVSFARAQTPVIDSLQRIIAQDNRDTSEIKTYIALIDEYARVNMAAAKRSAFAALALCRPLNAPVQTSAVYAQLVTINTHTNQTDSAKYYLGLLNRLSTQYPKNDAIGSNYARTAGLFYRIQGNYKASLPFMLDALRINIRTKNKTSIAGQSLNVGNNYLDMGDYQNAMIYHLKALNLFEQLGNKRGMSFCYGEIGEDFIKLNQYSAALPYVQKSMALKNELNDTRGRATAFTSQGEIQDGLHQPEKAMENYMEALKIDQALKLKVEEAKVDVDIGKLYAEGKDVNNANMFFNSGRELLKLAGDTAYLATVNAEMASLQKNVSDQQKTEKTLLGTLKTAVQMGDKKAEISNYKYLADFYNQNKQYDKALFYSEKYHGRSDSLQNQELQLQVKRLEQQYNLEKNEKEISLLKKDQLLDKANLQNQKLYRYGAIIIILMLVAIGLLVMARYRVVQKTQRLLEIEKMRNSIARNLHDDIGSTLSTINILSKVALKQAGDNVKIAGDLEKIKNSSFTIMESMSDIVWAINPANDPLDKTILKMREFAATILEPAGILFTFKEEGKIADLKLGVDERKNLYLIFKEAINNIAKYSGATTADIVLQKTAHQFLMKITDNGKGFDSTKQCTGNGLKNMKSRSGEMNADFEIDTAPGAGARIFVKVAIT